MTVQADNFWSLLGKRRINGMPNAGDGELCNRKKWLDVRIDESVLRWFWHVERRKIS